VDRSRFFAGVSGGVSVDTRSLVEPQAVQVDDYGLMTAARAAAQTQGPLPRDRWWWD
jgi:hypothetical protein